MDAGNGSSEDVPSEGLRARKRAAARSAIESTAVDLALRHGYDHVTVEMICTACLVSQRTFFNYFGSKEGVFLGPAPAAATEAVARAFLADAGTPVVLSLATAVFGALVESSSDPDLARRRMQVIMGSPELLAKQNELMTVHENQLVELVLERYRCAGRTDPDPEQTAEARLVVGLALGVVRVAFQENYLAGDGDAGDSDDAGRRAAGVMERSGELLGKIFGR